MYIKEGVTGMTRVSGGSNPLTREERSARMALVRDRDTKPNLRVRRFLPASGLRYRLCQRVAKARPDRVFPARRTVVFEHGSIWLRHPDPACPPTRMRKTRVAFWTAQFAGNVPRDSRRAETLTDAGWQVPAGAIQGCGERHQVAHELTQAVTWRHPRRRPRTHAFRQQIQRRVWSAYADHDTNGWQPRIIISGRGCKAPA